MKSELIIVFYILLEMQNYSYNVAKFGEGSAWFGFAHQPECRLRPVVSPPCKSLGYKELRQFREFEIDGGQGEKGFAFFLFFFGK
jgi:hypothetical protein